jgi:hypothetical protein
MGQFGMMSKAILSNLFPTRSKTELLVEKIQLLLKVQKTEPFLMSI